jgi:hypothetical protein
MSAQTQTHTPAKQAARNKLFAAALSAPQARNYPTHAAYAQAFEAYQADTMQPLREQLATA